MKKQDVIDMMICAVIFGAVFLVMMIALSIVGYASDIHGKEYVTYHEAGYNMTTYALMNAKEHVRIYEKEEKRRKKIEKEKRAKKLEEKKAQEEINRKYREIFGYIPSSWEIQLLKQFVQAESGNTEPDIGIERVAEVIANRVRSPRFPNTISGVLFQRGQFETYSNGSYRCVPNERVEAAWDRILSRGYCSDRNVLFFTAGGYNPYCTPSYVIGHHYFGY